MCPLEALLCQSSFLVFRNCNNSSDSAHQFLRRSNFNAMGDDPNMGHRVPLQITDDVIICRTPLQIVERPFENIRPPLEQNRSFRIRNRPMNPKGNV